MKEISKFIRKDVVFEILFTQDDGNRMHICVYRKYDQKGRQNRAHTHLEIYAYTVCIFVHMTLFPCLNLFCLYLLVGWMLYNEEEGFRLLD